MAGTLFEGIPPVTVRRWVRKLGKCLVPCTPLGRTYLSNQGLSKFESLISEDDLRALIHYSKIRRPYRKRASQRTTDHPLNTADSNHLPSSITTSASVVVDQTENEIARETQLQRTTDHTLNSADSNHLPSSSANSETDFGQLEDTIPAVECVPCTCSMPVQCKIGCLKREDTSPELQLKLDQLSEFYTSSVNH